MMKRYTWILSLLLIFYANVTFAGVVLGGTRIIYPASEAEVQVSLKNSDSDKRYLVQSWVSNIDDSKAPFIITPPVYKLEESRKTLLHVVYTGANTALPQDRESLFIMNVKSVSALPEELRNSNTLQLALKSKVKLFYRPAALKDKSANSAWESLTFKRINNKLVVKNPTPFYVTFGQLSLGGKEITPLADKNAPLAITMMVAPFSEQTFVIPANAKGQLNWNAINDYGAETELRKQSL